MSRDTAMISESRAGEGGDAGLPALGVSSFTDAEAAAVERARDLGIATLEARIGEVQAVPAERYALRLVPVGADAALDG